MKRIFLLISLVALFVLGFVVFRENADSQVAPTTTIASTTATAKVPATTTTLAPTTTARKKSPATTATPKKNVSTRALTDAEKARIWRLLTSGYSDFMKTGQLAKGSKYSNNYLKAEDDYSFAKVNVSTGIFDHAQFLKPEWRQQQYVVYMVQAAGGYRECRFADNPEIETYVLVPYDCTLLPLPEH